MDAVAEIFFELFPSLTIYILKSIWSLVLWVITLGKVPFAVSWESRKLDRLGLVVLIVLAISVVLYFTFDFKV